MSTSDLSNAAMPAPSVLPSQSGPMRRTSAVPRSVLIAQIKGGCGLPWCERTRPDHFAPRDCDCSPLGGQSH